MGNQWTVSVARENGLGHSVDRLTDGHTYYVGQASLEGPVCHIENASFPPTTVGEPEAI